jgi:hypothetical protein
MQLVDFSGQCNNAFFGKIIRLAGLAYCLSSLNCWLKFFLGGKPLYNSTNQWKRDICEPHEIPDAFILWDSIVLIVFFIGFHGISWDFNLCVVIA